MNAVGEIMTRDWEPVPSDLWRRVPLVIAMVVEAACRKRSVRAFVVPNRLAGGAVQVDVFGQTSRAVARQLQAVGFERTTSYHWCGGKTRVFEWRGWEYEWSEVVGEDWMVPVSRGV